MASIDKTYTNSWKEYQELISWAKENDSIFIDQLDCKFSDYIYKYTEEEFENAVKNDHSLPVCNTPQRIDLLLIRYCNLDLIQNRMKEVYDGDYLSDVLAFRTKYDTYKRQEKCKKVSIQYLCEKHNHAYKYRQRNVWEVRIVKDDYDSDCSEWWWNNKYNNFYHHNENNPGDSQSWYSHNGSIKALIRLIMKSWKLPKGLTIKVYGRYIEEEIIIKTR